MRFQCFFNNSKIKLSYIFIFLAIALLTLSLYVYKQYDQVEDKILTTSFNSEIEYVDDVTTNISQILASSIKRDLYSYFKNHQEKISQYEKYLQILITKRYKYVYIVTRTKNSKRYKFILDGSLEKSQKSEFDEPYEPLHIDMWDRAYDEKRSLYFRHKELKSLWITYLKPIVRDNRTEAIIAIDFSMKEHNIFAKTLYELDDTYHTVLIFFIIIFFIIIIFSYIDFKREKEKDDALKQVELINKNLEKEIKKAIDENRKKEQAMFQQSRLAQMGEMLSMIAHQWRQPLTAISSTATALKLKVTLKGVQKDVVIEKTDKIIEYSQHLSSTIDDFRDFFKNKKIKQKTNFADICESVLNIVYDSINNKGISIQKSYEDYTYFESYPNELKQVVLNLIKNAEDALIENSIEKPVIKLKTFSKGEDIVLEVSDNAGGIDEKIIDKIFDPYFSTKEKKDGTGLGLYMSKIIIEEHCGGKLVVENRDNGATFIIQIKGNRSAK